MSNLARIIRWKYPHANPMVDFQVDDIAGTDTITYWDAAAIGVAEPTEASLMADEAAFLADIQVGATGSEGSLPVTTVSISATVTIPAGGGSPAPPVTVSWTDHQLRINDRIVFTTTGTLPTGLTAGANYYVSTIVDADSFYISTTRGGSDFASTGAAGSGVHTATVERQFTLYLGRMSREAAQTISTATWTKIAFDTVQINSGQLMDNTNNKIVIQREGTYLFYGSACISLDAGQAFTIGIRLNGAGSEFVQGTYHVAQTGSAYGFFCDQKYFYKDDYLEVYLIHFYGANRSTLTAAEAPYFGITEVK
jgi:hypothetical protein